MRRGDCRACKWCYFSDKCHAWCCDLWDIVMSAQGIYYECMFYESGGRDWQKVLDGISASTVNSGNI